MRTRERLVLGASLVMLPVSFLDAQNTSPRPPGFYTLNGVVRDEGDAPIASAELALLRRGSHTRLVRSDTAGRFSFPDVRSGPVSLTARRMGYKASVMDLEISPSSGANRIEFQLEEIASDIDAVIVEGSKGHLREFYEHKATNNFGKFFDRKDIERKAPGFVSELMRTVPGATLSVSERHGNRILLRGCPPIVWIDGTRAVGAEVDELARPSDLAGVEVYPSWAGLPAQYQDRDNRMCGVIVLWTRSEQ